MMNFFKRLFARKNSVDRIIESFSKMNIEDLNKVSKSLKKAMDNKKFEILAGLNKESMERFGENYFRGSGYNKLGDYYDPDLETVDPQEKTLEELLYEHGFEDPRMDKLTKKVMEAKAF